MKVVMTVLGTVALLGGMGLFAAAFLTPALGQATLYAILSVAAFAFAGILLFATTIDYDEKV